MRHIHLLAALALTPGLALAEDYTAVEVENGGKIVGSVRYVGPEYTPTPVDVTGAQASDCGIDHAADDSIMIREGGAIEGVVVAIKKIEKGKAWPEDATYEMDQHECRFNPHVLVVKAGSEVKFLNSDNTAHNVHTSGIRNPDLNKTIEAHTDMTHTFETAETIKVNCDLHKWMSAVIEVSDHPYVVVTGADGSFELADVPAGTYDLEIKGERFKKIRVKKVEVKAGESVDIGVQEVDKLK